MKDDKLQRYESWYARLLHLYPKSYRERFGKPMAQTFRDLLQERAHRGQGLLGYALYLGCETTVAIIKENITVTTHSQTLIRPALVTALLLLIPFVAMQFGGDVNWSPSDFVVMGSLLFGTGLAFELLSKRLTSFRQRLTLGVVLLAGLLYVWAELAVGVFTTLGS